MIDLKSVGICTLGCKVNTYESLFVSDLLKKNQYEIKEFEDFCDIYIINTCTVTNQSDLKSRKMIRNAIKRNPRACIVVMGCFIESHHEFVEEGVDLYLGTKDKSKIVELLDKFFENQKVIRHLVKEERKVFEDMFITSFSGRTRAFVKIQDGCENFCSYCIIPFVRGKCRSKKFDTVIEEVTSLVSNGYKEIVLTGIHTGNYGMDIQTSFAELLAQIVKIKKLERLRISSIEITELNEKVLAILSDYPVIVDHLHIPLQAGSNHVLKVMNRKYDLDYFKRKVVEIRKIRPNIAITTDIIVGHPLESDEDFLKTIQTCYDLAFAKIHVFPYSLRSKTKAALMEQVDGNVKKERARKLLEVSRELEKKYMDQFIGKKEIILAERYKDGCTYGHTENYLHVKIRGNYESGQMVSVRLTKMEYPYIIGEVND